MEFLGLTLSEWILPIAIGVTAGFLTNAIAIWMLFHPYKPLRIWGVRVMPMGAIPKEIDRIARRIGDTVGKELLTPVDIARTLSSESFRQRFDAALGDALRALLDREMGSLRDTVTPEQASQLESVLGRVVEKLLEVVEIYLQSPEWELRVRGFARSLTGEFRDHSFSEVLTPELQADLSVAARELWAGIRESDEFGRVIGEALSRGLGNLLESEKPLRHYVPTGAVNLGEAFVAQYLPLLLERLGQVLDDPSTRDRLQATLHRFVDRFLEEQRTWKRIVGRLVITERTLEQTVEAIEQGGVEEISSLLREPEVQGRVAQAVNEGVEDLLDRPIRDLLGDVTPERAERLRGAMVERVLHLFRHPTTEDVVLRRLDAVLASAAERKVGDVLDILGAKRSRDFADRISDWLVETLRGPRTISFLRGTLEHRADWLLTVPIGRIGQYLPADSVRHAEVFLFDPLWSFIQKRVPTAVAGLPVAQMVENKLKSYPVSKVEELIWRISRKELVLIINLGGFLGALIGSIMLFTSSWAAGLVATGFFLLISFVFINLKG
ncbi:MAG TPA: DUF445 family protein [Longimicrobiaceae bacterium]|nr:DUF445 family protein [Longimicrobiaceae bacterium]